jgi:hypothetical protein
MFPGFSGIGLINADLTENTQAALVRQLQLSEVITGSEFSLRITQSPFYPTIVKQNNIRLMVVDALYNWPNRSIFDIVLFLKDGMISVLQDGYGPPRTLLPLDRVYWHELLHGTFPEHIIVCPNPNFQNNILYPLDRPFNRITAAPFGNQCSGPISPAAILFDLPVYENFNDCDD